ncbi:MAG: undecaprenyldiphospho-muramoylpentapeptide beta-N-acetylglucosaminyltransferase [Spirochaetota bacterium]
MKEVIVFTGGGTGGHVFPGLAVIEYLKGKWHGDITWIGSASGIERKFIEDAGIPFISIPSGKLRRYFSLKNILDIIKVTFGFFAALAVLIKLKPVLVFSKGGYVSVPPVWAAKLLGIPVITHESDLDPGLATRINSLFADLILVSYEETKKYMPPGRLSRISVTGNPVRAEILGGDSEKGRKILGIPPGLPLLLVLGGSQGASQINSLIGQIIGELVKHCYTLHQMGEAGFIKSTDNRYITFAFIQEELPHFIAAADLIVSRAGANSLWEMSVLGKPSILIPLSGGSRGDQLKNAGVFLRRGAAVVMTGDVNGENLLKEIVGLLHDGRRLKRMGEQARTIGNTDAAEKITEIIFTKAKRR